MITFWIGLPLSAIVAGVWVLRRSAVPDRTTVAAGIAATVMTALVVFGALFALLGTCLEGSGGASDEVRRLCAEGDSGVKVGMGLILLLPALGIAAGVLLAQRGRGVLARCAHAVALLSPVLPILLIALLY